MRLFKKPSCTAQNMRINEYYHNYYRWNGGVGLAFPWSSRKQASKHKSNERRNIGTFKSNNDFPTVKFVIQISKARGFTRTQKYFVCLWISFFQKRMIILKWIILITGMITIVMIWYIRKHKLENVGISRVCENGGLFYLCCGCAICIYVWLIRKKED